MVENTKYSEVDGYQLSYSSDWVAELESKEHWVYYWNQASLVIEETDKNDPLLEVGVGTSFLSNFLKSKGRNVVTIDIDESKRPDIVGDISSVPLDDFYGRTLLAFEIFEHIPFPLLERALRNFSNQNITRLLFSVPWGERRLFDIKAKLPKLKTINLRIALPKSSVTTQNHFWELQNRSTNECSVVAGECKGFVSYKKFTDTLEKYNYSVVPLRKVDDIQFFCANLNKPSASK
tara:strand:- start:13664 stop:14365 length:702 start_codon:yes stop_codon:yes gene_type:complete